MESVRSPTLSRTVLSKRSSRSGTPVGTSSAAQTVTISNTGQIGLKINSIDITGPFSQNGYCPPSVVVLPGATKNAGVLKIRYGTYSVNVDFTYGASQ